MKTKLYSIAVLMAASLFLFSCSDSAEDLADVTVDVPDFTAAFDADVISDTPDNSIAFRSSTTERSFLADTTITMNIIDLNGITGKIQNASFETLKIKLTSEDGSYVKDFSLNVKASATIGVAGITLGTLSYTDDTSFANIPLNSQELSISTSKYSWLKYLPFNIINSASVSLIISGKTDIPEGGKVKVELTFSGNKVTYNPLK